MLTFAPYLTAIIVECFFFFSLLLLHSAPSLLYNSGIFRFNVSLKIDANRKHPCRPINRHTHTHAPMVIICLVEDVKLSVRSWWSCGRSRPQSKDHGEFSLCRHQHSSSRRILHNSHVLLLLLKIPWETGPVDELSIHSQAAAAASAERKEPFFPQLIKANDQSYSAWENDRHTHNPIANTHHPLAHLIVLIWSIDLWPLYLINDQFSLVSFPRISIDAHPEWWLWWS